MGTSLQHIFHIWEPENLQIFEILWKAHALLFEVEYIVYKHLWRWVSANDKDWLNKIEKSWIWTSYLSKTWNETLVIFNECSSKAWKCLKPRNQKPITKKPFYFRVREAPTPLNIPIPTPASDHLLGGHNELKTTSFEWAWGKRMKSKIFDKTRMLGEYDNTICGNLDKSSPR